jgi:dihydropteroate synthase-like protein
MTDHIHFVTGRLAETALRAQLAQLAPHLGAGYTIQVLPITVAALMSPAWVARHLQVPPTATRVILPGYCEGDLAPLSALAGAASVERGPRDLRQLPEFFGHQSRSDDYGAYDIEILAEINHAPRLSLDEILRTAQRLAADGADLIDVGCEPGEPWTGVGAAVRALKELGLRVSIDSLNPREIAPAVAAGAELVLSVNAANRAAAVDWGCEVVVIPDDFATLGGLEETVEFLASRNVPLRIDPVLEPIAFGFAASLGRYFEVRRRYPDAEMLMGIGNLTELTDVDSAGVNTLLLGICQELGVRSVLTTQVINWARTSVRECDLARRLVHYAVTQRVPPKRVEPRLVTLRDAKLYPLEAQQLDKLAADIKDHNYRLFADAGKLHLIAAGLHLSDADPFLLFEKLLATQPTNVDAAHAFYLGFELSKALTALTLGKNYTQDEALDWGYLTQPERSHRVKLGRRAAPQQGTKDEDAP